MADIVDVYFCKANMEVHSPIPFSRRGLGTRKKVALETPTFISKKNVLVDLNL